MNLTYAQLIRGNRNFRNLLLGQVVSELGNWFNFIAGLGLVRLVSDASPMAAGILLVCRLLPFAFVSPIAGTLVDRLSRRRVMIYSDLIRFAVALMFLFVANADNLWIAYVATMLLASFGAFFDGGKNASLPNMTGREGLLAGTALMFSTRFLLMAVGSALGGFAAALFGYKVAFVINALSFLVSAYSVWLIPEEATREDEETRRQGDEERKSFVGEMREGLSYTIRNHFALTILIMNVIWATGGGAINVIFERLGGVYFAERESLNPDLAVAVLWTVSGLGLTLGMLVAHRVSAWLDRTNLHSSFITWTLLVHGILFAVGGYMPELWLVSVFVFVSRAIVGVEYAVQETMFQRSLPDYIRGRISTLDRGAEMTVFGFSIYASSLAVYYISPQMLTVISGILSATAGLVWFVRNRKTNVENYNSVTSEA